MAFVFFLHRVESGDQTQVAQLVGSKFISLAQTGPMMVVNSFLR